MFYVSFYDDLSLRENKGKEREENTEDKRDW